MIHFVSSCTTTLNVGFVTSDRLLLNPLSELKLGLMLILGIQFLALIVICYVFLVYATRDRLPEKKGKRIPGKFVGMAVLIFLAFILFASWYVRLGLAS